jgi:hypothetical protein
MPPPRTRSSSETPVERYLATSAETCEIGAASDLGVRGWETADLVGEATTGVFSSSVPHAEH